MNLPDHASKSPLEPLNLFEVMRMAGLVKAWDLSGAVIARFYERLLRQHGRTPRALAERSSDKDQEFYEHLFDGVELPEHLSVLDIGCGMGDLIDFLQLRQAQIDSYLGIDLVGAFIDICQKEYLPPCRFRHINFVSPAFAPHEQFDLVVNMGVLVSRVFQYEAYVEYCVGKMIALSKRYVLFNVITELDQSLGNYKDTHRVGNITYLPRKKLVAILGRATARRPAAYQIDEVRIYPDATDAFVRIRL
jgi:SAM-dependent methyltransferase